MSYELNFWRYQTGIKLDAQKVYQQLSQGEMVAGLAELPSTTILDRITETFKHWNQVNNQSWQKDNASFLVTQTPHYFRVDCSGLTEEDMNAFIDIGLEFDCPLYDPQTKKRYELPTPLMSDFKDWLFGFFKKK